MFRKQRGCKRIQLPEQVWTLWASLTVLLTPPLWDTHYVTWAVLWKYSDTSPYNQNTLHGLSALGVKLTTLCSSAQFSLAWASSAPTSTAQGPAVTAGQLVEQHYFDSTQVSKQQCTKSGHKKSTGFEESNCSLFLWHFKIARFLMRNLESWVPCSEGKNVITEYLCVMVQVQTIPQFLSGEFYFDLWGLRKSFQATATWCKMIVGSFEGDLLSPCSGSFPHQGWAVMLLSGLTLRWAITSSRGPSRVTSSIRH